MRRLVAGLVLILNALMIAPGALAHESVTAGGLSFVVGWENEPAYAGFLNAVELRVTQNGQPATGIPAGAIKVAVSTGDQSVTLPLSAATRNGAPVPGVYLAAMIPTRPGTYTFHFTGTAKGQKVDVKVTSGPTTFNDITNPNEVQFPDKPPSATDLGARVEREIPRVRESLAAQVRAAEDSASGAKLFGYLGLGIGIIALVLAIAAMTRKRT